MASIELPSTNSKAVTLLNNLDPKKVTQLFDKILEKLPIEDPQTVFSFEEKQKLIHAFQLNSTGDLALILSASVTIWRQVAFYMLKPAVLTTQFISLGFSENMARLSAQIWEKSGGDVINRLKNFGAGSCQLTDVNWTLNIDIASGNRANIKEPIGCLDFLIDKNGEKEHLPIEMNHGQLLSFYEKMENIQTHLDDLAK